MSNLYSIYNSNIFFYLLAKPKFRFWNIDIPSYSDTI